MNQADIQYLWLVLKILEDGFAEPNNRTGTPTRKVFGESFRFDLRQSFPILTTKHVAFKSAVNEMLWIYQKQSNKISDLGSKLWDEWALPDGTIGNAYGYVVKKHNQIDTLIHGLKTNPYGRRHIMSLWDIEELPKMSLQPCAFMTIWDVQGEYLNCNLIQRSADVALGVPFNFTQYAVLVRMIAQVVGLKPGILKHDMTNAHIYVNHIEGLQAQLKRTSFDEPTLWLNPDVKDFYQFTPDDIKLIGYQHHPAIKFEVAV